MNDLVSIIMPLYNKEKYVLDAINSVICQSYINWELIIVDDKSTDNSLKIVKKIKDKRIKIFKLDENSGVAITRNIALNNSKGRFICYLDADDLWKKDKLEKQIKFINDNNYGFIFSGFNYMNNNSIIKNEVLVPSDLNYNDSLKNTIIWTSTVMIDVNKISKELLQMPNIIKGQDTSTWWKILKNGYIAYGMNESLAYYRRNIDTSLSYNKIGALKRTWNLYGYENLSIFKRIYYFICYVYNAIRKRM